MVFSSAKVALPTPMKSNIFVLFSIAACRTIVSSSIISSINSGKSSRLVMSCLMTDEGRQQMYNSKPVAIRHARTLPNGSCNSVQLFAHAGPHLVVCILTESHGPLKKCPL